MISGSSNHGLRYLTYLAIGTAIVYLLGCNSSQPQVPEPDYNQFVLKPGSYVESNGVEVNMDTMAPPEIITVKGQWLEAATTRSKEFNSQSVTSSAQFKNQFEKGSKGSRGDQKYYYQEPKNLYITGATPKYFQTAPSPVDMSRFSKPVYTPSVGVNIPITLPHRISAQLRMENEGIHYLGRLNQQLGLSSDFIDCLLEDRFGRIWMGTMGGLSISDGKFLINLTEQEGLPGSMVKDILEDQNGNIWIALQNSGVVVWNGAHFTHYTTNQGLSDNRARSLLEGPSGKIWIGTANGLNIWDGNGFERITTDQGLTHNNINELAIDGTGLIWIGTWGGGINLWDGRQFSQLTTEQGLSNDAINKIIEDGQGNVWIATAGAGLNKWDGRGLTYINKSEGLKEFWITDVMEDSQGGIWIAGNSGVQIYDGKGFSSISDSNGLKFNVVNSLLRDSSGRIWVGTAGGGMHVVTAPYTHHYVIDEPITFWSGYRDLADASGEGMWITSRYPGLTVGQSASKTTTKFELSLAHRLYEDNDGTLLIASNKGLILVNIESIKNDKVRYLHYDLQRTSTILEDHNGNIWIGARWSQGLYFWDRSNFSASEEQRFINYSAKHGLVAVRINGLAEDRKGRIWVASTNGIYIWDGIKFINFTKQHGLGNNEVRAVAMTRKGHAWIATKGGINIYDGRGMTSYNVQHGLPSNGINSLHVDKNDNVWAGTNSGLVKLWMDDEGLIHFQSFNEYQGVDRSNIVDALIDHDGKVWAISQHNMDIIDPKLQPADTSRPKLAVTGIQPFFDQFDWRQVRESISEGVEIETGDRKLSLSTIQYDSVMSFTNLPLDAEFPHNINHLTFEWSSTYWAGPLSIQYSYILEGQDQSWSPLIKENSVTYNDLRPGDYNLRVRAVAGNARWSETVGYSFKVLPPLWATWWAYGLYGLCALGLVLGLRHYERKRFVLRQKAHSLEEIDKIKTEFFTNISHELRTPLTLILGPLKALQEGTYKGDRNSMFTMMSQNGRRLLQLVNQLLDLSKLDQGKLKLQRQHCDINHLVGSVVSNFDSAASTKNIDLEYSGTEIPLMTGVDQEKIKQVLFNLIGNALKFTPEGGSIKVNLSTTEGRVNMEHGAVKITVRDSGIGIPIDKVANVFDRFYQVKSSPQSESEGTGIGLALARELVHLHQGTIEVESEPDWGTTFTVILPLVAGENEAITSVQTDDAAITLTTIESDVNGESQTQTTHNKPSLLIVEDNAQMREYITACLGDQYQYLEAANGVEGLAVAESKLPDLILSDVMMPEMDGYEFCREIRSQNSTSHIPFIFLTAKADQPSLIQGLEIGSNDYVTKPFDDAELRLKVRNHLDKMEHYRSFFGKQLAIRGDIETVESLDDAFLNQAIEVIEVHLDQHEFTVSDFAREIGMSQTQLYRKLMTLTGQSPTGFIRSIRLKKAGQLIIQNYGNVSDIAYAVGFNNLSYFAKCFKEQFGVAPSSYGKKSVTN